MTVRLWVTPLGDRVVVAPDTVVEENVEDMFQLPDGSAKERPQKAEIIAVGPGRYTENGALIPMRLEVGQVILHGMYAGTEITIDGRTFLILREDECMGILVREEVEDEETDHTDGWATFVSRPDAEQPATVALCGDISHSDEAASQKTLATHVALGPHGLLHYCEEHARQYRKVMTVLGHGVEIQPPLEDPATTPNTE